MKALRLSRTLAAGRPLQQTFLLSQVSRNLRCAFNTPNSIHNIIPPAPLFSYQQIRTMASDEDYSAFLDKANQDTGSAQTQSKSKSKSLGTKAVDTDVPAALKSIEEFYQSDSDEPFEPVALKWKEDSLPDEDALAKLIGHDSSVESLSEKDFDPRGNYKNVVEAVKKAGSGEVRVYRVQHGSTRVEYYVVSVDKKGGRLVGLKALAVES